MIHWPSQLVFYAMKNADETNTSEESYVCYICLTELKCVYENKGECGICQNTMYWTYVGDKCVSTTQAKPKENCCMKPEYTLGGATENNINMFQKLINRRYAILESGITTLPQLFLVLLILYFILAFLLCHLFILDYNLGILRWRFFVVFSTLLLTFFIFLDIYSLCFPNNLWTILMRGDMLFDREDIEVFYMNMIGVGGILTKLRVIVCYFLVIFTSIALLLNFSSHHKRMEKQQAISKHL